MQERPAQHVNQEEWRRIRDEAKEKLRNKTPLQIPVADDSGFYTYMAFSDMDFGDHHSGGHHGGDHGGGWDAGHIAGEGLEILIVAFAVQTAGCLAGWVINSIARNHQINQQAKDYADLVTGRKQISVDSRRGRRIEKHIQNPQ